MNRVAANFPNLSVALSMLLLVTTDAGERSFPKLKLIETHLQSTITQERPVGLATMTIERDLLQNIETEKKFYGEEGRN
ncbi:hypothetical protein AVEN_5201-1 [Araneus ventricosus]|uniref:HAT C-terminal dimerisation domain-containing protein n=1 Tax=Araneus ventricosus TaxID=182803 RepID=A0A4Y2UJM6_ARAVE|nr:hypothetical protein AVEN_5201-1 [Araneus ventricosus]